MAFTEPFNDLRVYYWMIVQSESFVKIVDASFGNDNFMTEIHSDHGTTYIETNGSNDFWSAEVTHLPAIRPGHQDSMPTIKSHFTIDMVSNRSSNEQLAFEGM